MHRAMIFVPLLLISLAHLHPARGQVGNHWTEQSAIAPCSSAGR